MTVRVPQKVTANEEFFNGHFPARPIMPGVLQIEAMAQVGGIVALQEPITDGKGDFFFAGVTNVKWRRPVVPGDTLVMEMELTAFKARFGLVKMKGVTYVDGQKVVEGDFQFAMVRLPARPCAGVPKRVNSMVIIWRCPTCAGEVSLPLVHPEGTRQAYRCYVSAVPVRAGHKLGGSDCHPSQYTQTRPSWNLSASLPRLVQAGPCY